MSGIVPVELPCRLKAALGSNQFVVCFAVLFGCGQLVRDWAKAMWQRRDCWDSFWKTAELPFLKHSPWKVGVGGLVSFWGPAYFQGLLLLVVGSVKLLPSSRHAKASWQCRCWRCTNCRELAVGSLQLAAARSTGLPELHECYGWTGPWTIIRIRKHSLLATFDWLATEHQWLMIITFQAFFHVLACSTDLKKIASGLPSSFGLSVSAKFFLGCKAHTQAVEQILFFFLLEIDLGFWWPNMSRLQDIATAESPQVGKTQKRLQQPLLLESVFKVKSWIAQLGLKLAVLKLTPYEEGGSREQVFFLAFLEADDKKGERGNRPLRTKATTDKSEKIVGENMAHD